MNYFLLIKIMFSHCHKLILTATTLSNHLPMSTQPYRVSHTVPITLEPNGIFSVASLPVNPVCWTVHSPLSLYLEDDSAADHSGGDVLLFIGHSLDLAKLAIELGVYVGEHGAHGAAGYVEDILAADDQESQQHEAEEEFGDQGPHRPSKSTQHHATIHSLRLQGLLFPMQRQSRADRKKATAAACCFLSLVQLVSLSFSSCLSSFSWSS